MIGVTAQVTMYPLPKRALAPEIGEVLQIFRGCALEVEPDNVATFLVGDDDAIFAALRQAFCHAAAQGQVVMVVTPSMLARRSGKRRELRGRIDEVDLCG